MINLLGFREPEVIGFREPDGIPPRGTLIVIPGRGEQPEVYKRFGTRLSTDAYRVYVLSDPTTDAERTREQLRSALEDVESTPAPVVLVGSDGGALFTAGLVAQPTEPAASGAAPLQLDRIDGLILAGLPSQETGAAADDWEQELNARTTCPTHRGRISDELVTPGALYNPLPGEWFERATLEQITLPILGLHGQEDPISAVDYARGAFASAPAAELVTISGAPHDVLNDQTHRTVAATTILWLERLRVGSGLTPIAHTEPVGANVV